MDNEVLTTAWTETAAALPPHFELCGVVYHGPQRKPGTEWVAFLCDPTSGNAIGPEGVGDDPVVALRDLARAIQEDL